MGDKSMSLKTIRAASLGASLLAAALLAGCVGDILGGRPRGPYDPTYDQSRVRGTVVRVDTRDRFLVVDRDTGYDNNLRNDDRYGRNDPDDRYGDQVTVYYDERTTVEHDGRSYRPEDLERGDRIEAIIFGNRENSSTGRLIAEQIQVLYDATADTGYGGYDQGSGSGYDLSDLRGIVRYVDTRDRSLEIEPSRYDNRFSTGTGGTRSDVVRVYYDSQTDVQFQGRRYAPENLDRGDEVEVAVRDTGGRLIAQRITVVGENRPLTR
jgi:hypothetical protein